MASPLPPLAPLLFEGVFHLKATWNFIYVLQSSSQYNCVRKLHVKKFDFSFSLLKQIALLQHHHVVL